MRTFNLIGMALLAVVMCVSFTSCSDDEEYSTEEYPTKNEYGIVTNQKKLVKMLCESPIEEHKYYFSYDEKGRLSGVNYLGNVNTNTRFTWNDDNTIVEVISDYSQGEECFTHILSGGLVQASLSEESLFAISAIGYNKHKRMEWIGFPRATVYPSGEAGNCSYTWLDNKVVKCESTCGGYDGIWEYSYSGETCNGYLPPIPTDDNPWCYSSFLGIAHPELFGMRSNQLIDKCKEQDERYDERSYTLDEDGYVVKTCIKRSWLSGTEIITYTWE